MILENNNCSIGIKIDETFTIVSLSNKEPFELRTDYICLYDFEDNYYEINYDGKIIE